MVGAMATVRQGREGVTGRSQGHREGKEREELGLSSGRAGAE